MFERDNVYYPKWPRGERSVENTLAEARQRLAEADAAEATAKADKRRLLKEYRYLLTTELRGQDILFSGNGTAGEDEFGFLEQSALVVNVFVKYDRFDRVVAEAVLKLPGEVGVEQVRVDLHQASWSLANND